MTAPVARFHIDTGPAALFERVSQVFAEPVTLRIHGSHLAERTAGVDAPLADIEAFDPQDWELMTVEARRDTGRFVTTAWRRTIGQHTWWVVIGYHHTVRTLFRSTGEKSGRGPDIVTAGAVYQLVERVNRGLV